MPGFDPVRVGIGRFPAVTVPPCVGVAVNAGLRAAGGYGQNRKVISYMPSSSRAIPIFSIPMSIFPVPLRMTYRVCSESA